MTIGVAIPAYSGPENLRACLRSIAAAAPAFAERTVVVDDTGTGRIANELAAEFPTVRWMRHERNAGFGQTANDAVRECHADIVVLLNDDVQLLCDPTPALEAAFADATLFAATFRSQNATGAFREGAKRLVWPMGLPRILHNEADQLPVRDGLQSSDYAVGGHAAFRRNRFLELGGFDPLFDPFYWEDVDLSVRARRRGWNTVYLPECVVQHEEHGAIRTNFERARIREITLRNRLLFAWRHSSSTLRGPRAVAIAFEIFSSLLTRERTFLRAFAAAKQRWREFGQH